MSVGDVFFLVAAVVALVGAVWTIASQSPIRSALGLLTTIVGIAALFLRLNAQFLAAIQLIVYAGAVVVLFVFVIMLLGPDAGAVSKRPARARGSRVASAALVFVLAVLLVVGFVGADPKPTKFKPLLPEYGSVEAVGQLLFSRGLVPFELSTALLIVAAIGAIAVARARHTPKRVKTGESPTRRLFHGPLHPRDAGRPLPKEGLL
ncbi:MAG: NADH-quinone oxidoreductase subunit J [Myxococcota bacterium]|jgi:NADH-quinone oxidoreductase subunit J|nr:NADH-quinone oxidoreductase subunit J [Myxococcota bacterium]